MGINRQSDESASLQIGPTSAGMVRIYVSSETVDLPMDFSPDDAEEIARELMAAAESARRNEAATPAPAARRRPEQARTRDVRRPRGERRGR